MEPQEHQTRLKVPGIHLWTPSVFVGVWSQMLTDACCFQRAEQEMHNLQFSVGLEKVSPAPCPSHSLLVKIQTNLRDRLEHAALLGICPPHPVSTIILK